MTASRGSRRLLTALVAGVLLLAGRSMEGRMDDQTAAVTEVKAAIVSSFAQFIEWPSGAIPATAPLLLCVVNDSAVADAVERTIQGRSVGGHSLAVKSLASDASVAGCQVVYIAGSNPKRSLDAVAGAGARAFTVGESSDFTTVGGMVRLFRRSDRLRFEVNVDAVQRSGLKLSSRVLALGDVVRDKSGGAAPPDRH